MILVGFLLYFMKGRKKSTTAVYRPLSGDDIELYDQNDMGQRARLVDSMQTQETDSEEERDVWR